MIEQGSNRQRLIALRAAYAQEEAAFEKRIAGLEKEGAAVDAVLARQDAQIADLLFESVPDKPQIPQKKKSPFAGVVFSSIRGGFGSDGDGGSPGLKKHPAREKKMLKHK